MKYVLNVFKKFTFYNSVDCKLSHDDYYSYGHRGVSVVINSLYIYKWYQIIETISSKEEIKMVLL